MSHRKCDIPGCILGEFRKRRRLRRDGIKIGVFSLPGNTEQKKKWKEALRKSNIEVKNIVNICELHFQTEDVFTSQTNKETALKYSRTNLKPGAVPSIFGNIPFSTLKLLRTPTKEGCEEENANLEGDTSNIEDSFTYYKLCEELHLLKKPNHWWGITFTGDFVICARWNDKYIVEKKVIIQPELNVKIYINDLQINITDGMVFTCISDISTLLKVVEGCRIDTTAN